MHAACGFVVVRDPAQAAFAQTQPIPLFPGLRSSSLPPKASTPVWPSHSPLTALFHSEGCQLQEIRVHSTAESGPCEQRSSPVLLLLDVGCSVKSLSLDIYVRLCSDNFVIQSLCILKARLQEILAVTELNGFKRHCGISAMIKSLGGRLGHCLSRSPLSSSFCGERPSPFEMSVRHWATRHEEKTKPAELGIARCARSSKAACRKKSREGFSRALGVPRQGHHRMNVHT